MNKEGITLFSEGGGLHFLEGWPVLMGGWHASTGANTDTNVAPSPMISHLKHDCEGLEKPSSN